MKKFYKLIALAMVATMTVSLFTGCSSSSSTPDVDEETLSLAAEIFADVEPLEETLSIDLGILTAAPHGFNNVLIELLGGYSYANLDANLEVFGSGPVLIEAMVSGAVDAGIYGLGGTLPGTITHGLINIAPTAPDYDGLKIFAPNDSEIVLSGMDESTGIYGTAEMWEGQEIFCSVGTTLYYALAKGLDRVGLSLDDVTVTHMSPENTNTALRAGQCEIGGLWGTLSYGDILENFTPVISAGDVDVNIITQFAAPPRVSV